MCSHRTGPSGKFQISRRATPTLDIILRQDLQTTIIINFSFELWYWQHDSLKRTEFPRVWFSVGHSIPNYVLAHSEWIIGSLSSKVIRFPFSNLVFRIIIRAIEHVYNSSLAWPVAVDRLLNSSIGTASIGNYNWYTMLRSINKKYNVDNNKKTAIDDNTRVCVCVCVCVCNLIE